MNRVRERGRVARLIDAGLEKPWRARAVERSVVPEPEKSGLGIECGRLDLNSGTRTARAWSST